MGVKKKICVVGLGYIGLPTALSLANENHEIVGVDTNKALIDTLNKGQVTFKESGLIELFKNAQKNSIRFSTIYDSAEIYILTVPTPYISHNRKIDISYVQKAFKDVLEICDKGSIIVIESTVSPGTINNYIRPLVLLANKKLGEDLHIVHAPERIIPGDMINELKNNARTIGADDMQIAQKIKEVYEVFCEGEITLTDIKSAEMTKVVENTYRDINIAFANELAKICHSGDMDVYEVIRIANKHPRVNILSPGPGVGGHCISVDPWFLVGDYPKEALLINQARNINDSMPKYVLNRIAQIMKERGISCTSKVGLYGLTYKEDVDDTRESPTLQLLDIQKEALAKPLKVYDPMIDTKMLDNQIMDLTQFLDGLELVVVMVSHSTLKEENTLNQLKGKAILDTRNCLDKSKFDGENIYSL